MMKVLLSVNVLPRGLTLVVVALRGKLDCVARIIKQLSLVVDCTIQGIIHPVGCVLTLSLLNHIAITLQQIVAVVHLEHVQVVLQVLLPDIHQLILVVLLQQIPVLGVMGVHLVQSVKPSIVLIQMLLQVHLHMQV